MARVQTSPLAVLPLSVSAGVTQLTLNVLNDSANQAQVVNYAIGVYIDGVYSSELVPGTQNAVNALTLSLDGSAHSVDLWNSYQNFKQGSFVYSYSISGGSGTVTVRNVAAPTRRLVVYTDSIGSGAVASPLTQQGWPARLRAVYPGRITLEAWGGRSLWDDSGTTAGMQGLGSITNLATRLVSAAKYLSPTTREIWIQIGYNDYGFGGIGRWSAASYGTAMASLLDGIHTLDSAAIVYLASPIITSAEATTNSFSNTIGDYRTQCSTAASGRGWVTFVDGTQLMIAAGLSGDGIHPTSTGHLGMFDGSGGDGSTKNIRGILNV